MIRNSPDSVPFASAPPVSRRVRRALVVFIDRPATRLHRLLRSGFRHCFVVIDDGAGWVLIDPLKHRIEVRRLDLPETFDLAGFYARRGHHVLAGQVAPKGPPGFMGLEWTSCVTVVKRVLALFCPLVQTPHQLYRHLYARAAFIDVEAGDSRVDSEVK